MVSCIPNLLWSSRKTERRLSAILSAQESARMVAASAMLVHSETLEKTSTSQRRVLDDDMFATEIKQLMGIVAVH